jgi:hypothetical protein
VERAISTLLWILITFVRLPHWNQSELQKHFASHILNAFVERELLDSTVATQILEQEHTGFAAWAERIVEPEDTEGRLFLARYLAKSPLALDRIALDDTSVVVLAERRKLPDWTSTPLEFLARLSAHIPRHYEHLERFFGRYSSATRGKRGDLVRTITHTEGENHNDQTLSAAPSVPSAPSAEPQSSCPRATRWATLMARIYELQPLTCLNCGTTMLINAFITDPFEIQRLLKNVAIPHYRAPPPLPDHYQPGLPLFE